MKDLIRLFRLQILGQILALGLLLASGAAQAEVVGRVLMAIGDTTAVRAGQVVPLKAGSTVENKDTLHTGKTGQLQVRFVDESLIALRANSQLRITDYRYQGKDDSLAKSFLDLVKGGFRTTTGYIGKINPDNYKVKTEAATIGIRGTHYLLMLCQAGLCLNTDGGSAPNGLYGGVVEGRIVALNNAGEFPFSAGQYFHAPDADSAVRLLLSPPGFLFDRLPGQGAGGPTPDGAGQESLGVVVDGASDSRPTPVTDPPPAPGYISTEDRDAAGNPAVLPQRKDPPPPPPPPPCVPGANSPTC